MQYTYRGAYLNALSEAIVAGMSPESVYLWTLPMFHCNGWCFPWAVTAVAARHVALRAVDPELVWRLIDEEGVTHYNGAPTVQLMIINDPNAHRLEQPVTAMVAASPPSPTLLARMAELNFRIVHVYGLTETYGPITVCPVQEGQQLPLEQRAKLLARQGQAYPSADLVRVVDEDMHDIPQDAEAMGEVVMRGNNVMSGYFAAARRSPADNCRDGTTTSLARPLTVRWRSGQVSARIIRTAVVTRSSGKHDSLAVEERALFARRDCQRAPVSAPTQVEWLVLKEPARARSQAQPPRNLDRAMSLHLFAGLRVRDFQAARPWYERLLGEPTFFAHATEAVWTLADDRSVYVVEHADGAGNAVLTIFVDDLDARVAAVAARGVEPDERLTYSNGVRKALYRDPDGNELGFGGSPLNAGS